MPDYKKSALLCIRITRVLLLVLAATMFAMPPFVKWYAALRLLSRTASTVLLVAFYLCTVPAGTPLMSAICASVRFLSSLSLFRYSESVIFCFFIPLFLFFMLKIRF